MDTPSIPLKRCSRKDKCIHPDGPWLPKTAEYFVPDKRKRDGFCSACRLCRYANRRRLYAQDPERYKAYTRKSRDRPGVRARERELVRQWRVENPERAKELKRQNHWRHKAKKNAKSRAYYNNNRDKALGRYHTEKGRAQILATEARRKARKRSLPNTFTTEDWQRALDYFKGCCAVCERPAGLWHKLAVDHWIPLASPDCPGTVPTNVIPLCHGQDGCNNSKRHKQPEQWLIDQFGKHKAKAILKRIHSYFEWVKAQSD